MDARSCALLVSLGLFSAVVPPGAPALPRTAVAVNQLGYHPDAPKTAVFVSPDPRAEPWSLVDVQTGEELAHGLTSEGRFDAVSGDLVHSIDFSAVVTEGTWSLVVAGTSSPRFRIAKTLLAPLARDALLFFYRSRSGIPLEASVAGATWARPAGHLSDGAITAWDGGYQGVIDGRGGWYDAGDFGKYTVNGAVSAWALQNAVERGGVRRESVTGLPAMVDEARFEVDFLLRMQIPAGAPLAGMAYHKLHDRKWSGVPAFLEADVDNNNGHPGSWKGRFVYEPTTAATLDLAAVAAQANRLWRDQDGPFAQRCLDVAETAWRAALAHPDCLAGNVPGDGGGNYDDPVVSDEFYWAAAELAVSTGKAEYWNFVRGSPHFRAFPGPISWADTGTLGTLTLVGSAAPGLTPGERASLVRQVVGFADAAVKVQRGDGYRVPLKPTEYVWGSTAVVLNSALVVAQAFDLTGNLVYRDSVVHSLDYLLGMNSLGKSFVTGYGTNPVEHPHHRLWAADPELGFPPPPPGAVAGGPNANLQDGEMQAANLGDRPVAQRYLDVIGSYATNEVAINWNAPLAWVTAWLDRRFPR